METEVSRPKRIKCLAVPHTTSEEFKNATFVSGFVFGENSAVRVHFFAVLKRQQRKMWSICLFD